MRKTLAAIAALLPLAAVAQVAAPTAAQTPAQASGDAFERWFDGATRRYDYYHAGDADDEQFFFADLHRESDWAGSRVSLIDEKEYGNQMFRIVDAATGETIYSRGYCTLWDEWSYTAEARTVARSMPESVIFPFPRNDIRIELYSRDRAGEWVKKHEQEISPSSYFIARYPPRYETFDVEVNGDPAHRVDIVLLPEGYTEAERPKFEAAAKDFAESVFSFEPYKELRGKFNIRAVWVPSADSGVTMPGSGVWKNSSAGASFWTFDSERYQMTEDFHTVRDQAGHVPYEFIYILSNSDKYGGGGIYNFYGLSSAGDATPSKAAVYIHEFGHLFLGLGDEYVGGVSYDEEAMYPPDREPWEVNITTLADFAGKEWSRMLPAGTPVPTPVTEQSAEQLGVYEGGGYQKTGVYRPWPNCLMNNLHTISKFCPVCEKGIRDQIEFLCR
jgi:hypothetical protein